MQNGKGDTVLVFKGLSSSGWEDDCYLWYGRGCEKHGRAAGTVFRGRKR